MFSIEVVKPWETWFFYADILHLSYQIPFPLRLCRGLNEVDTEASIALQYDLGKEKFKELFPMEKEQELHVKSDGGERHYLAVAKKLYVYGRDGGLIEEKRVPEGYVIVDIADEAAILYGKGKVHYYSLDKDEIVFSVDGEYVGMMDPYLVLKHEDRLQFIEPKGLSMTSLQSPTKLHPLVPSGSSLLLVPKDGGIVYYKIHREE